MTKYQKALEHHYRRYRAHQRELMANGQYMLTTYRDGSNEEKAYGSAPYGEHAYSALMSAKRHIYFMERLAERAA